MAAEVQPGDGLLARVAALGQADRPLDEARLGRHDAVVELAAPARAARLDAQPLELVFVERLARGLRVQGLPRILAVLARARCRPAGSPPSTIAARVLLGRQLDLGGEARALELRAERLAEPRLRGEQEVVVGATEDPERRNDPRLRREQKRVARLARRECLDVVRDHALHEVGSVRAAGTDVVTRARSPSAMRSVCPSVRSLFRRCRSSAPRWRTSSATPGTTRPGCRPGST